MSSQTLNLVSCQDGRIQSVSVYTGRAEVTRWFRFKVEEGQTQVNISGLPNVLERESVRVEGRGRAAIHDITICPVQPDDLVREDPTSPLLRELEGEEELLRNALHRNDLSKEALELYIKGALINLKNPQDIGSVVDGFNQVGGKVDEERLRITKRLDDVEQKMAAERQRILDADGEPLEIVPQDRRLRMQLGVGIFAEKKGKVELIVTYAVTSANWDAHYDIRVNTLTREDCVTLHYQAKITQNTGEAWENVELTLDTAKPSYNSKIPELVSWNLMEERVIHQPTVTIIPAQQAPEYELYRSRRRSRTPSMEYSSVSRSRRSRSRSPRRYRSSPPVQMPVMVTAPSVDKGNITATFRVPGTITIPGDGQAHSVSVAQLRLDANLTWITVPKADKKADILNASEYAFVPGNASIYVDGSFISKTTLPLVSPGERFDCALGLDPSIRVTYHPRTTKKASKSAFVFGQKTVTLAYSQRITVQNTKPSTAENIKVIDQVPVSQDERIGVRLISPGLTIPTPQKDGDKKKGVSSKDRESSIASNRRPSLTINGSSLKTLLSNTSEKGRHTGSVDVRVQWDGADKPTLMKWLWAKMGKSIGYVRFLRRGVRIWFWSGRYHILLA
ncbi:hypothetical protein VNI00_011059 [Paramarasmius palmivorus]|uniref:Mucoidy inhibitor A n=1 Tax=Paramarasmius palmivorus TaxID=297713 RepID=A0AAW0CEZ8_9AGAR